MALLHADRYLTDIDHDRNLVTIRTDSPIHRQSLVGYLQLVRTFYMDARCRFEIIVTDLATGQTRTGIIDWEDIEGFDFSLLASAT